MIFRPNMTRRVRVAADFQDLPDIFAGHGIAGGTNRLDDPHGCAFFPPAITWRFPQRKVMFADQIHELVQ